MQAFLPAPQLFAIFGLYNLAAHQLNLRDADLTKIKNPNLTQIKAAKNWEKAKYSDELRSQLGLPTKTR
jgi:hypothetical protein